MTQLASPSRVCLLEALLPGRRAPAAVPDALFSAVRGYGAGLARGTQGLWRVRGSGLRGALLGLLQEVLGCRLKRKSLCRWYLLLEVFPGRGEEARKKAVGDRTGRITQGN